MRVLVTLVFEIGNFSDQILITVFLITMSRGNLTIDTVMISRHGNDKSSFLSGI